MSKGWRPRSIQVYPNSEAKMENLRQRLKEIAFCLHIRSPMIQQFYRDHELPDFTKGACKNKDGENLVLEHVKSTRCDLCAAYGSLSLRQPTGRDKSARFKSGPRMELLNCNEFNRRKDIIHGGSVDDWKRMIATILNPFRPWIELKDYFRFPDAVRESTRLKVARNQFGEMYHILVFAILNAPESNPGKDSDSGPRVLINLIDATHEQKELFEFYAGAFPTKTIVYKKWEESSDSKSKATQGICTYFWKSEYFDVQERLFRVIRAFMRTEPFCGLHGNKYVSTDYSAKYWINRFLLLSGQGKLPKPDGNVSR